MLKVRNVGYKLCLSIQEAIDVGTMCKARKRLLDLADNACDGGNATRPECGVLKNRILIVEKFCPKGEPAKDIGCEKWRTDCINGCIGRAGWKITEIPASSVCSTMDKTACRKCCQGQDWYNYCQYIQSEVEPKKCEEFRRSCTDAQAICQGKNTDNCRKLLAATCGGDDAKYCTQDVCSKWLKQCRNSCI
jgi:hypothetical protein